MSAYSLTFHSRLDDCLTQLVIPSPCLISVASQSSKKFQCLLSHVLMVAKCTFINSWRFCIDRVTLTQVHPVSFTVAKMATGAVRPAATRSEALEENLIITFLMWRLVFAICLKFRFTYSTRPL